MLRQYILKRILLIIPVLFVLSTIVFFLIHAIPGDPVDLIAGEQASEMERAQLAAHFHFDQPILMQYGHYLWGLVHGDLGKSYFTGESVISLLNQHLGATLVLAFAAMISAIVIAIPLGVIAAVTHGRGLDQVAMFISLLGISVPNFWLGPVLILLFAVKVDIFPISGYQSSASLILPALTLGAALAAMLSRMTRSSMLEELGKDYVITARAKGVPHTRVIAKHVLRNALNPVITIVGLQTGALLAGTVITEKIFNWPGIGTLMLEAISTRDYAVVSGCILLISLIYVMINTLTDCLYKWVDPRVDLSS